MTAVSIAGCAFALHRGKLTHGNNLFLDMTLVLLPMYPAVEYAVRVSVLGLMVFLISP